MTEINAIGSSQPSLIEAFMNSVQADSCMDCVQSASSIDELSDKLKIIENVSTDSKTIESINRINELINNGLSLDQIQSKLS